MSSPSDMMHLDRTRRSPGALGCLPTFVGSVFMLFGSFFTLVGLVFIALTTAGIVEPKGKGDPIVILAMVVLLGMLALAVGAALVFGRRGSTFDRRRGAVSHWWKLGPLTWSSSVQIGPVERVELWRRVVSGSKGSSTYYPVDLRGPGEPVTILWWERDESRARAAADQVARFSTCTTGSEASESEGARR